MKKLMKRIMAFALAALTLLGVTACGKVEMPQGIKEYLCVEHTYGAGEVERWATCIREGRVKHTCTECGHEKFETLTKVSHTPYTVPAREATCALTGYTEHTACAVCGTVISGKTTTPKTTCDHTNDFYAGMGVYECGLCGDERMLYGEQTATTEDFSMSAWYRCYLPNSDSRLEITFYSDSRRKTPFGNIVEPSGDIPVYKFTLIISYGSQGPKFNVILFGGGESYNAVMSFNSEWLSGGHDYVELIFNHNFSLEGQTEAPYDLFCDVAFNNVGSFGDGVSKVMAIESENGAKLVRLEGVNTGEYPDTGI